VTILALPTRIRGDRHGFGTRYGCAERRPGGYLGQVGVRPSRPNRFPRLQKCPSRCVSQSNGAAERRRTRASARSQKNRACSRHANRVHLRFIVVLFFLAVTRLARPRRAQPNQQR